MKEVIFILDDGREVKISIDKFSEYGLSYIADTGNVIVEMKLEGKMGVSEWEKFKHDRLLLVMSRLGM